MVVALSIYFWHTDTKPVRDFESHEQHSRAYDADDTKELNNSSFTCTKQRLIVQHVQQVAPSQRGMRPSEIVPDDGLRVNQALQSKTGTDLVTRHEFPKQNTIAKRGSE
jgi:hypothetical protein